MRAGVSRPAMRWLMFTSAALGAVTLAAAPRTAKDDSRDLAASRSTTASGAFASDAPPAQLRIGNIEFEVRMQPFSDTYAGITHFDTHVVQIDPSSQADERQRVYLHEMMHVAWHDGKPSADKARKYTEEEAIQSLTPGLLKMLKENPQSVKYLFPAQDNQVAGKTASK